MNAQLNDLHDRLQRIGCEAKPGSILEILNLLEGILIELKAIDARLEAAEGLARHANNTASCLANGIQPD